MEEMFFLFHFQNKRLNDWPFIMSVKYKILAKCSKLNKKGTDGAKK